MSSKKIFFVSRANWKLDSPAGLADGEDGAEGDDGRRGDGVAAVRLCAVAGRRDSQGEGLWRGTVRWGVPRLRCSSGTSPCGLRCTGGDGADGGAMVVVQEVGKQGDTRRGGGEVTGDDQRLAAPSCPLSWPCRHRHHDHFLILGPKQKNQSRHSVPNSKYYHFVEVSFGWYATCAEQKFQQTLLARKGKWILGN